MIFSQAVELPLRYLQSLRFETMLSPGLVDQFEDRLRIAGERIAELDAKAGRNYRVKPSAAVFERHIAKTQLTEVRQARIFQDYDFAVDDRTFRAEGARHTTAFASPAMPPNEKSATVRRDFCGWL
ncbi:hypothetical protein AB4Z43_28600 [Mesorhizobium sp. 2RAF45]|uniref:hypothetical protein n=1 Tax=Mesorhizobium sp. 2RAF45 TaxID=3233001 RepID=UPI003F9C7B61